MRSSFCVEGLDEVMMAARLQDRLGEAVAWCEAQGVTTVLMLQDDEDADEMVKALQLQKMPGKFLKKKLVEWGA